MAVPDDATRLYVDVRLSEDDPPTSFVVSVAKLPTPPEGSDDDVEIVLEGELCP